MPPQDKNFVIKQKTPEADKLERRIHEEIKEIWDPAADETVARYLTAMLAKGYERKKIHQSLKAILQESVTVQLLDWLYKHLRLHGNEYQSSSKPAAKAPPSVAKAAPVDEDELRLEDLEAQQLEGSDLDEDQPDAETDGAGAEPGAAAQPAAELDHRERAAQQAERQPPSREAPAERAGPTELHGRHFSQPAQAGPTKPADAEQAVAAAAEPSSRPARRHREPIPIPNFTEVPREKPAAASAAPQLAAQDSRGAAGASGESPAAEEDRQAGSPTGDRRRLKSSVVLDWATWNKQKQPGDGKRQSKSPERQVNGDAPAEPQQRRPAPDRDERKPERKDAPAVEAPAAGRDRAPLQVGRASSGRLDPPRSAAPVAGGAGGGGGGGDGEERPARRDSDRDRDRGDRDRGDRDRGDHHGSDRRRSRQHDDTDPPESRSAGRDDAAGRRRTERGSEGGGGGGGGKHRGSSRERERERDTRRSRSRSRSRSPRGGRRREGRPLLATANLLRTALRGVDGQTGGARPSVFARLGQSGARQGEEGVVPPGQRTSRGGGHEKEATEPPPIAVPGRKRGPEGDADPDAAILGSPPKAARNTAAADKPAATSAPAAGGSRPDVPAATGRTGPAASKQRVARSATPPAIAPEVGGKAGGRAGGKAGTSGGAAAAGAPDARVAGGKGGMAGPLPSAAEAAAAAAPPAEAAELEALRRQMALMQEQLARMEASKQQPAEGAKPTEQLQALAPATQPSQPRSVLERLERQPIASGPLQGGRLGPAGPMGGPGAGPLGGGPRPGLGNGLGGGLGGGLGMGMSALVVPDDVVIEGGAGSPPSRRSPTPTPAQVQLAEAQLLAAQLDAEMRTLVVGNVHFLANEEVLAAHFSVAGPVNKVTLLRDNFNQQPTGMAVVEMATEHATQAAAALSGSLLMDLPIVVTLKAALLLQGIVLTPEVDAAAAATAPAGPRGPGPLPAGRLNPAAAPFVPGGLAAGAGPGRPSGGAGGRGPAGMGRAAWPGGRGAGGRGMGGRAPGRSHVWVRDASAATVAAAPSAAAAADGAAGAGAAT